MKNIKIKQGENGNATTPTNSSKSLSNIIPSTSSRSSSNADSSETESEDDSNMKNKTMEIDEPFESDEDNNNNTTNSHAKITKKTSANTAKGSSSTSTNSNKAKQRDKDYRCKATGILSSTSSENNNKTRFPSRQRNVVYTEEDEDIDLMVDTAGEMAYREPRIDAERYQADIPSPFDSSIINNHLDWSKRKSYQSTSSTISLPSLSSSSSSSLNALNLTQTSATSQPISTTSSKNVNELVFDPYAGGKQVWSSEKCPSDDTLQEYLQFCRNIIGRNDSVAPKGFAASDEAAMKFLHDHGYDTKRAKFFIISSLGASCETDFIDVFPCASATVYKSTHKPYGSVKSSTYESENATKSEKDDASNDTSQSDMQIESSSSSLSGKNQELIASGDSNDAKAEGSSQQQMQKRAETNKRTAWKKWITKCKNIFTTKSSNITSQNNNATELTLKDIAKVYSEFQMLPKLQGIAASYTVMLEDNELVKSANEQFDDLKTLLMECEAWIASVHDALSLVTDGTRPAIKELKDISESMPRGIKFPEITYLKDVIRESEDWVTRATKILSAIDKDYAPEKDELDIIASSTSSSSSKDDADNQQQSKKRIMIAPNPSMVQKRIHHKREKPTSGNNIIKIPVNILSKAKKSLTPQQGSVNAATNGEASNTSSQSTTDQSQISASISRIPFRTILDLVDEAELSVVDFALEKNQLLKRLKEKILHVNSLRDQIMKSVPRDRVWRHNKASGNRKYNLLTLEELQKLRDTCKNTFIDFHEYDLLNYQIQEAENWIDRSRKAISGAISMKQITQLLKQSNAIPVNLTKNKADLDSQVSRTQKWLERVKSALLGKNDEPNSSSSTNKSKSQENEWKLSWTVQDKSSSKSSKYTPIDQINGDIASGEAAKKISSSFVEEESKNESRMSINEMRELLNEAEVLGLANNELDEMIKGLNEAESLSNEIKNTLFPQHDNKEMNLALSCEYSKVEQFFEKCQRLPVVLEEEGPCRLEVASREWNEKVEMILKQKNHSSTLEYFIKEATKMRTWFAKYGNFASSDQIDIDPTLSTTLTEFSKVIGKEKELNDMLKKGKEWNQLATGMTRYKKDLCQFARTNDPEIAAMMRIINKKMVIRASFESLLQLIQEALLIPIDLLDTLSNTAQIFEKNLEWIYFCRGLLISNSIVTSDSFVEEDDKIRAILNLLRNYKGADGKSLELRYISADGSLQVPQQSSFTPDDWRNQIKIENRKLSMDGFTVLLKRGRMNEIFSVEEQYLVDIYNNHKDWMYLYFIIFPKVNVRGRVIRNYRAPAWLPTRNSLDIDDIVEIKKKGDELFVDVGSYLTNINACIETTVSLQSRSQSALQSYRELVQKISLGYSVPDADSKILEFRPLSVSSTGSLTSRLGINMSVEEALVYYGCKDNILWMSNSFDESNAWDIKDLEEFKPQGILPLLKPELQQQGSLESSSNHHITNHMDIENKSASSSAMDVEVKQQNYPSDLLKLVYLSTNSLWDDRFNPILNEMRSIVQEIDTKSISSYVIETKDMLICRSLVKAAEWCQSADSILQKSPTISLIDIKDTILAGYRVDKRQGDSWLPYKIKRPTTKTNPLKQRILWGIQQTRRNLSSANVNGSPNIGSNNAELNGSTPKLNTSEQQDDHMDIIDTNGEAQQDEAKRQRDDTEQLSNTSNAKKQRKDANASNSTDMDEVINDVNVNNSNTDIQDEEDDEGEGTVGSIREIYIKRMNNKGNSQPSPIVNASTPPIRQKEIVYEDDLILGNEASTENEPKDVLLYAAEIEGTEFIPIPSISGCVRKKLGQLILLARLVTGWEMVAYKVLVSSASPKDMFKLQHLLKEFNKHHPKVTSWMEDMVRTEYTNVIEWIKQIKMLIKEKQIQKMTLFQLQGLIKSQDDLIVSPSEYVTKLKSIQEETNAWLSKLKNIGDGDSASISKLIEESSRLQVDVTEHTKALKQAKKTICYCQGKKYGDLLTCRYCGDLFHRECMGWPLASYKKSKAKFSCFQCSILQNRTNFEVYGKAAAVRAMSSETRNNLVQYVSNHGLPETYITAFDDLVAWIKKSLPVVMLNLDIYTPSDGAVYSKDVLNPHAITFDVSYDEAMKMIADVAKGPSDPVLIQHSDVQQIIQACRVKLWSDHILSIIKEEKLSLPKAIDILESAKEVKVTRKDLIKSLTDIVARGKVFVEKYEKIMQSDVYITPPDQAIGLSREAMNFAATIPLDFVEEIKLLQNIVDDGAKRYCVCKKFNDGSMMIECDGCKEWFHTRCLGIDPPDESDDASKFICPRCTKKNAY